LFSVSLKESKLQLKLESVGDDEAKRGREHEAKAVLVPLNSHSTTFSIEAVKCGVPKTVRLKP